MSNKPSLVQRMQSVAMGIICDCAAALGPGLCVDVCEWPRGVVTMLIYGAETTPEQWAALTRRVRSEVDHRAAIRSHLTRRGLTSVEVVVGGEQ